MLRLLLVISALAAALSGCVSIAAESARQLDEVGDVELTTVICASQANTGANCPASNTSEVGTGGTYQLLMAYRLPTQSSAPESITATEVPLTLSRSASYTDELQRLAGPPAGQRWVGYISPPFDYSGLQSEQTATVVARIMLLRDGNGAPFPSPFRYRTIVGYRQVGDDPNRPVRCGDTLWFSNSEEETTCMTSPSKEDLETDAAVDTRDLGILNGATGSVPRGGSGAVDFTVGYSGASASPSFALAATTTVPGGTVAPAAPSVAPAAAGNSALPVTVDVPASTPPGTYEVTLTATHPNGQNRRASGLVRVTGDDPVDRSPPEVAARMKSTPRVKRALKIGMVADVSCSETCLVSAQLRAGRKTARRLRLAIPAGRRAVVVGSVTETVQAAGRRNVRIRFRRGLGPKLRRLRRIPLLLRVTARDPAGNVRNRSIYLVVRR